MSAMVAGCGGCQGRGRWKDGGGWEEPEKGEEGGHMWRLIFTTQVSLQGVGSMGNRLGGAEGDPQGLVTEIITGDW